MCVCVCVCVQWRLERLSFNRFGDEKVQWYFGFVFLVEGWELFSSVQGSMFRCFIFLVCFQVSDSVITSGIFRAATIILITNYKHINKLKTQN